MITSEILDKFHEWTKKQDFHHCYPDNFKVIDFLLENPELKAIKGFSRIFRGLPKTGDYVEIPCDIFNFTDDFYYQYERYFYKVIRGREWRERCRRWRSHFGKEWKQQYREGFTDGYYFSGEWRPMLVSPRSDTPYDYAYVQGRNSIVSERK